MSKMCMVIGTMFSFLLFVLDENNVINLSMEGFIILAFFWIYWFVMDLVLLNFIKKLVENIAKKV